MAPIRCSAPNCETTFQEDLDPAILIRLLDIHKETAHPRPADAATQNTANNKPPKVSRPCIDTNGSSEDWQYFLTRWDEYKLATNLNENDAIFQLLECCSELLRKDIIRSFGTLTDKNEIEALECIKKLAVKPENILVARVQLLNLRQDRDETVRAYCARLRGQAGICRFIQSKVCVCEETVEIDYSNDIIRDTLIRGLEDDDIRLDVLGQCKQDLSLDETVQMIEAKESGKRSAGLLTPTLATTANATSSYKRFNKTTYQPNRPQYKPNTYCGHCGKRGHHDGRNREERESKCPAFNHVCNKCHKLHHYEKMCKSPRRQPYDKKNNSQDAVFQDTGFVDDAVFENESGSFNNSVFDNESTSLCSTNDSVVNVTCNSIKLDYHIYNDITNAWQKSQSSPQPCLPITISVHPSDIENLGFKNALSSKINPVKFNALADSGCQSCLGSLELLEKMQINKHDLLPVTMSMTAANNKGINIIGALPLRLSGKSPSGSTLTTRQIVYFTDSTDKFFLSKLACIKLGILSKSFPTIGETLNANDMPETPEFAISRSCECPSRQLPPPPPTQLPCPPTAENRDKIEKFLLEYYKSSTFNICQHQNLPMMSGPPLRIMLSDDAQPVAYHKPTPVPVHWQEDVYNGLQQDVQLGVIEPVPVGTPVTWCHKMVVIPKKSGKPRRTVDLQPLNKYALRETHHTESPFHQARAVPHNTFKTVTDAWNGFHSILLHEEDRHLTTFITPKGRFRYRVAPQGYIASGDAYTRRFDEIIVDIPRKTKCVDDTLLWDSSIEAAFHHTVEWLDLCGNNGVSLNPTKFVFAQDTVEFAGFEITNNTVRPAPRYLQSIKDFPTPKKSDRYP